MGLLPGDTFFEFEDEPEAPASAVIEAYRGDLCFNGINGATGNYGLEPMPPARLAALITGMAAEMTGGGPYAGLSPEEQDLVDGLTLQEKTLLEELILGQRAIQLAEALAQQRASFEGLVDPLPPALLQTLEQVQDLFEETIEHQRRRLFAPLSPAQRQQLEELIARQRERVEREQHRRELAFKRDLPPGFPIKEGADPTDLAQAGWAVLFPAKMPAQRRERIKAALKPLLALRQEEAGDLFRVYEKGDGYRPGETKARFFARHKIGDGAADPQEMPFYVLVVGNPEEIPYSFQYQLDVMRGVGRLDFGEDWEAYEQYAQHVVQVEREGSPRPMQATFFAPANPDDKATHLSMRYLVRPIYRDLQNPAPEGEIALRQTWTTEKYLAEKATKAQLHSILHDAPPAFLMVASHGMEFPCGDQRQLSDQGALLCQDWPGPQAWRGKPIPPDFYFAGRDVGDADLQGLIALFFACYGAGTPKLDQFARQAFKRRQQIAPHPFVADLPRRMLRQGALAILGHVERAWGYSFVFPDGGLDNQSFVTAVRKLLNGDRLGLVTDVSFNMRYADKSSALSALLEEIEYGETVSEYELAQLWTANNDARGYVLIGDPAVRLVHTE